ncbi:MAG: hypothetical protein ACTSRG_26470 [Candidatus Helarchaeota archaeon]
MRFKKLFISIAFFFTSVYLILALSYQKVLIDISGLAFFFILYIFIGLKIINILCKNDNVFLSKIFIICFSLNISLSLLQYIVHQPEGFIYSDSMGAFEIANYIRNSLISMEFPSISVILSTNTTSHILPSIIYGITYIIYPTKLSLTCFNSFLLSCLGIFAYKYVFKHEEIKTARITAVLIMISPSLQHYASSSLKEIILAFILILIVYFVGNYSNKQYYNSSLSYLFVITVISLIFVRIYVAFAVSLGVLFYILFYKKDWRKIIYIFFILLTGYILLVNIPSLKILHTKFVNSPIVLSEEIRDRGIEYVERKNYFTQKLSKSNMLTYLLSPIVFLTTPNVFNIFILFNWDWFWDAFFRYAGTLLWLILMPYCAIGILKGYRKHFFVLVLIISLVLIHSYFPHFIDQRHRIALMPLFYIFSAIGLKSRVSYKNIFVILIYLGLFTGIYLLSL